MLVKLSIIRDCIREAIKINAKLSEGNNYKQESNMEFPISTKKGGITVRELKDLYDMLKEINNRLGVMKVENNESNIKLKCSVCGELTDLYHSSSITLASYAYCEECSKVGAEPYWPLVWKVVLSGGIKKCSSEVVNTIKISVERIRQVHPHLTFLTYEMFLEQVEEELSR